MAVNNLITLRKGTASQWNSANPVLASGEPGYDLTNQILKVGDGVTAWNSLSNHKHTASNISDFNSSVSGILPVKDIVAGSNITISSNSGTYTINSTGGGGGSGGLAASSYVTQGKLNSYQSIAGGSDVLIDFVDHYDPQGWWNPTTHKFQPNVAGYYLISVGVWWDAADVSNNQNNTQVRLSGTTVMILQDLLHSYVGQSQTGSKIVYMNGTTDYVDFTAYTSDTGGQILQYGTSSGSGSWFTCVLLAYSGQPTVTNYGANRVLISDNTTTGMSAQSGLTFDGSTLTAPSGSFSSSLKVNNVNVSVSGHNHIIGDITGLQSALDGKQASGSYASSSHTHTASQVTDFNTSVSGLVSGIYAPLSSPTFTGTVNGITKSMVGLDNVDNTSDTSKPISSATQTALDNKAALSHTHTSSNITDFNSSVSGLISGYSLSGHTHAASNISDSTTAGRALLTAADASAQRTSLGLGTLATQSGTFSGTSSGTNTGDQTISIGGDVTAAGSTGALTATVTKINGVSLAGLSTGLLKNTTSTGAPTIAVAGTDYVANIVAGTNITVSGNSGTYTINSTGSSVSTNVTNSSNLYLWSTFR